MVVITKLLLVWKISNKHAKKDDGSDVRVCDGDEVSITGEDSKFMKVTPTIIPGGKRQHVYIFLIQLILHLVRYKLLRIEDYDVFEESVELFSSSEKCKYI